MTKNNPTNLSFQIFNDAPEVVKIRSGLLNVMPMSIYQTSNFLESWQTAIGAKASLKPVYIVISDNHSPIMFIPFCVKRIASLRIAEFMGGKHSNFNMALFDANRINASIADLKKIIIEAGRSIGIDTFNLTNQPDIWKGISNPLLVLGSNKSPSFGYSLDLHNDFEGVVLARLSKDNRKKIRQKQTSLAKLGEVLCFEAINTEQRNDMLKAYFKQKSNRFDAQGIKDPFADPVVKDWLHTLANMPQHEESTCLRLFGLTLNGDYVAVWGVGTQKKLVSGMFTSFDITSEAARSSPGEILLIWLIRKFCEESYTSFDLGVGEARYKKTWCNQTIQLFDTQIGASVRGCLVALILSYKGRLKRSIKKSVLIMSIIQKLRVFLRRKNT